MDLYYNPLFPLADGMEKMPDRPQDSCFCEDGGGDNGMLPDNGGNGNNGGGSGMPDGSEGDMNGGGMPTNDSIAPNLLSLAMGFVPRQTWQTPYDLDVALTRGTIFPGLDKPFLGEPPLSPQTRDRMGGF